MKEVKILLHRLVQAIIYYCAFLDLFCWCLLIKVELGGGGGGGIWYGMVLVAWTLGLCLPVEKLGCPNNSLVLGQR